MNICDFTFSIPTLIEYISAHHDARAHRHHRDGTPSSVGTMRKPPVFLKQADVVQVEIAEIGVLENPLYPSG